MVKANTNNNQIIIQSQIKALGDQDNETQINLK